MSKIEITKAIYEVFDSYRKNPYSEKFNSSRICEKIRYFVENELKILLVFPGFHGKIKNQDFVMGSSVDMGEVVALQNIAGLLGKINNIYKPGTMLYIIHEGHFHLRGSSLITPAEQLDKFLQDFRKLLKNYTDIKSLSIFDLFPDCKSLDDCLDCFYTQYAPSDETVCSLIAEDQHYLNLYTAYKKINSIQLYVEKDFCKLSKKDKQKQIKVAAINQMRTTLGFNNVIKTFFKDKVYIRLSSLYKEPSFTDYVSINYLPDNNHFSTPTFNCLVQYKDGKYDFIKKSDALKMKLVLTEDNGFKYFKEEYNYVRSQD